jgi:hypothetical protein
MPEIVKFWYYPKVEVEVSWGEVEELILFSEHHYDGTCRNLSKQGGVLYGMRNRFDARLHVRILDMAAEKALRKDAKITVSLTSEEVGLIAKCCENNDVLLLLRWLGVGHKLNDEYLRLNPRD